MELDWSAQSPHIRTLYHPWQPGDGWDEATIQAAEEQLGVCLPATLRNFYLAWGKRCDLTFNDFFLLNPDEVGIEANTLFFCADYRGYNAWGVRQEVLEEADPPVVYAYGYWDVESERIWTPSHPHLSNFLDDMTYCNAFSMKGAIHGGWTRPHPPALAAQHIAWLEENWSKASIISPLVFGLAPEETSNLPPLYVRDGQALWWGFTGNLAARDARVIDEIGKRFQIKWHRRW